MAKPKIVILDEPTSGLDPVMQKNLFEELKRQTADGVTVLLSSHNLAEVQEYCQRVAFIQNGEILAVIDLSKPAEPQKTITVSGGKNELVKGFELIKESGEMRIFRSSLASGELLDILASIAPDDFTVENESMEERFWNLYRLEKPR